MFEIRKFLENILHIVKSNFPISSNKEKLATLFCYKSLMRCVKQTLNYEHMFI